MANLNDASLFGMASIVVAIVALFLGVRWVAHYTSETYSHPVFLNWIVLLPLAGWAVLAWVVFRQPNAGAYWLGLPVLCLAMALVYNAMRTNLVLGVVVTALQALAVVPVAIYVAVFVVPIAALLLIVRVVDPRQFDIVPPDTAHNRRLNLIYGDIRTRQRRRH